MKWFAAHIVMVVQIKGHEQSRFPVWENIVLISAASERQALAKAEETGRHEQGDDDGTFCWGGRPARWVFAGVRKLTECAPVDDRPDDRTEITYNELEFASRLDVKQFAAGRPVSARYNDRFRAPKNIKQTENARRLTRRPASQQAK